MKRVRTADLCVVAVMAAGFLSTACEKSSSSGGGGSLAGGQAVAQAVSRLGCRALAVVHGQTSDGKAKPLGAYPISDYVVACDSGHISVHSSAYKTTPSGGGVYSVSGDVVATSNSCVVKGETIAGGWTETFNITATIVGTQVTANGTVAVPRSTVDLSGSGFTGSCTVEQTVTFSNLKYDMNTLTPSGTVTASGSACGYTHDITCDMATGACQ